VAARGAPSSSLGPRGSRIDDGFLREMSLHGVRSRCVFLSLLCASASACEPTVVIGDRQFCAVPPGDGGHAAQPTTPVSLPWSTGFEAGFCDYAPPLGWCYTLGSASFSIVTSPVHSGKYAAAFTVSGDADAGSTGGQARCVQQGAFPGAAYYGAWYYVPEPAVNSGNWNLFHFASAITGQPPAGLWDMSLVNRSDGGLYATLFDTAYHEAPVVGTPPPIPIAQWFHLEAYFKRATDSTAELTLWQDGVEVANITGLGVVDVGDWGQWYVGNLATALQPPTSTVYVDDVTIGTAP
jgi:hypothetical protein